MAKSSAVLLFGVISLSNCVAAGEVVVNVSGLTEPFSNVGCSLFSNESGFPTDNSKARNQWVPASVSLAVCRFRDVPPGKYAVSVGHDANGNRKVDTNFLGIPTE